MKTDTKKAVAKALTDAADVLEGRVVKASPGLHALIRQRDAIKLVIKDLEAAAAAGVDPASLKTANAGVARALRQYEKLVKTAQKQRQKSAKEAMPPELDREAKKIARLLRKRLVNPKDLKIIPWVDDTFNDRLTYSIIFRVPHKTWNNDLYQKTISVQVAKPGAAEPRWGWPSSLDKVVMKDPSSRETPVNPKEFVENFMEGAKGWEGFKGEGEANIQRAKAAQGIASALNRTMKSLSAWGDWRKAEITPTRVEANYRSGLPKEGAYSVGEYKYEEMVEDEIKKAKKAVDRALSPYKNSIKKVDIYDGEKSWIYVQVHLK